jgi:ABC-type transporter Mla subunit MlaD
LGSRVSSLTAAADSIAVRIAELNRSAGDVAKPLVTTAEHLRVAGQAAQNAAEPLNQAAGTISRSLDQVAGVAQRLNSAQAASERLIESLNAAVQRFEGVDQELARTLQGLQTGLQGFAREVATVVSQTDQNLAKAATQLGSLVNSLQTSLEDFAITTTNSTALGKADGDPAVLLTNQRP